MKSASPIADAGMARLGCWLAAALALAFALACKTTPSKPVVDSNTNWLKRCTESAECGARASCLCGLCTLACEDDASCAVVGDGARCESTTEGVAAERCEKEGRGGADAVCVVACEADDTCRAEALQCVDGLCELSSSGAPMTIPDGGGLDAANGDAALQSMDGSALDGAMLADAADASPPDAEPEPCAPGPCQNGGRCAGDGNSCECPVGISGSTCSIVAAVRQLALGELHTCALLGENVVKCWGSGEAGQIGQGTIEPQGDEAGELGASLAAVDLGSLGVIHSIAAGDAHTCALFMSGEVKCWGQNADGQLGLGDTDPRGDMPGELGSALPIVPLSGVVRQISAGADHTCARFDDGRVACWGRNLTGQLGIDSAEARGDAPAELGGDLVFADVGGSATHVLASVNFSCAVLEGDQVKCWGMNLNGQLGQEDDVSRGANPGDMAALDAIALGDVGSGIRALDSRGVHACALLGDGATRCWGFGGVGQLGLGGTATIGDQAMEMGASLAPARLGAAAEALAAGGVHACAVVTGNVLKCWGQNNAGQLGVGDTNSRGDDASEVDDMLPSVMLPAGTITQIAAGTFHTCVVLNDADIYCFGENSAGQLGRGNTDDVGDDAGELTIPGPPVAL